MSEKTLKSGNLSGTIDYMKNSDIIEFKDGSNERTKQANCDHKYVSIGLLGKTGDIYKCEKCGKEIDMSEGDDF